MTIPTISSWFFSLILTVFGVLLLIFSEEAFAMEIFSEWNKTRHQMVHEAGAYRDELDNQIDSFAVVFRVFFVLFLAIFGIAFLCACKRACCRRRIGRGVVLSAPGGPRTTPITVNITRNRNANQYPYENLPTTRPLSPIGGFASAQPYQTQSHYGTTNHYPAPPIVMPHPQMSMPAPPQPGFSDLPPPPPYEPPAPQQPGFNPNYSVNNSGSYPQVPPPGYSEKS